MLQCLNFILKKVTLFEDSSDLDPVNTGLIAGRMVAKDFFATLNLDRSNAHKIVNQYPFHQEIHNCLELNDSLTAGTNGWNAAVAAAKFSLEFCLRSALIQDDLPDMFEIMEANNNRKSALNSLPPLPGKAKAGKSAKFFWFCIIFTVIAIGYLAHDLISFVMRIVTKFLSFFG